MSLKGPVVTLGNFDGVHIGHRKIIGKVIERARAMRRPAVVYTFEPHPLKVVAPHMSPPLITDNPDKRALIEGLGADYLMFARFTREFASKHPREFVEEVIVKGFGASEVWVGANFVFGKERRGTVEYLKTLGKEYGFRVFGVPPVRKGGQVVSSSRIRALIREGEVGKASALLGRDYSIKGRVVKGAAIGRSLGFPTANIKVISEIVPGDGVYAARASIDGASRNALINVGTAPTFGERARSVEAHILGFRKNIYGRAIRVSFLERLRDEKRFPSEEALKRQIKKDIERAKGIFKRGSL